MTVLVVFLHLNQCVIPLSTCMETYSSCQIYKLFLACFRLGFIPNGNRIYYENRSQPPYFIPSVFEYYQSTGDFDFVKSLLPTLEQEYSFWMSNRTVEVQKPGSEEMHLLNRYDVFMGKPR